MGGSSAAGRWGLIAQFPAPLSGRDAPPTSRTAAYAVAVAGGLLASEGGGSGGKPAGGSELGVLFEGGDGGGSDEGASLVGPVSGVLLSGGVGSGEGGSDALGVGLSLDEGGVVEGAVDGVEESVPSGDGVSDPGAELPPTPGADPDTDPDPGSDPEPVPEGVVPRLPPLPSSGDPESMRTFSVTYEPKGSAAPGPGSDPVTMAPDGGSPALSYAVARPRFVRWLLAAPNVVPARRGT